MLSSTTFLPHQGLMRLWILTVCVFTIFSGSFVTPTLGAPAKLDALAPPPQSPFPLEAQPTQFTEAIAAALKSDIVVSTDGIKSLSSAVDSYGNPIETLKPIDTPDGRKVISAQGLQFEIPNYASGITEIKKPADDLLPPFIGEFNNNTNNYTKKHTDFSATHNQQNINETNNYISNMTRRFRDKEDDFTIDGEVNSVKTFHLVSYDDDDDDEYNTVSDILNKSSCVEAKIFAGLDTDIETGASIKEEGEPKVYESYRTADDMNGKSRNESRFQYHYGSIGTVVHKNNEISQQNGTNSHKHCHNEAHPLIDSTIKTFIKNTVKTITSITTITTTSAPISLRSAPKYLNKPQNFTHLAKNNSIKHTLLDLTRNAKPHIKINAPHPPSANQIELLTPHLLSYRNKFINKNYIARAKRSPIPSSSSHRNALLPLSNGNFNYPNVPTDLATINRIAAKYHNPLPTLDPIAVAVPTGSVDGESTVPETAATALTTTTVDVENAQLVELRPSQSNEFSPSNHADSTNTHDSSNLPSYILDLNDPDIGGPVEYMPADDESSLKVIAWDLLPPLEQESKIITADNNVPKRVSGIEDPLTKNMKVSLTSGQSLSAQGPLHGDLSEGSVAVVPLNNLHSGNGIQFTSSTTATTPKTTTPRTTRPITTRTTTITATTRRPTTTTRRPTTTTRRTTTTKRTTTTTTTTSAPTPVSPNDYYQLENGDSYTLPSWLADIDDPELDAAVTYIVPDNIHEYNDTISRDLLPPLEPYSDLNNIDLPAPEDLPTTTTTTNRPRTTAATSTNRQVYTTTPRSSTISTPRPHWVRAYPTTTQETKTTTTQKPKSFDDRTSSNHIAQSHDSNTASSFTSPNLKASTSFLGNSATSTISTTSTTSTTTTTERPGLSSVVHHHHNVNNKFNQNSPATIVDHITSTELKENKAVPTAIFSNANPFLPAHNSGARPFATQNADKFTSTTTATTTTTTTTTSAPVEESPFDSATLPPWLADFDYPDLGPGVPFIYDAEDSNSDVANDLLPPSQLIAEGTGTTKPVFITSSPSSFNSFQISPSSTNRHETTFASASTSPTRTFTFNNFPSKVTTTTVKPFSIQNPFAQVPNSNNNNNQEAVTLPPVLFIPPNAEAESNVDTVAANDISKSQLQPAATAGQTLFKKPSSSSFNKNFAAPFEPTTASGSADSVSSSDQDFGSSTKTTFTKSNEGKVITNNISGNNGVVTTATKQFGFSTTSTTSAQASLQKDFQQSTFSGSSATFNKAVTPSGFTSTQQTNFNSAGSGKYTGGFGGAPGVLGSGKFGSAVNTDGTIRTASNVAFGQASTTAPKLTTGANFASRIGIVATGAAATGLGVGVNKYQGTFGGPPGVLTPFDNVKSG